MFSEDSYDNLCAHDRKVAEYLSGLVWKDRTRMQDFFEEESGA